MLKQIEIISDELRKAIRDGLFNDIWYFIKDFKNYKLQFILEYYLEDNDQRENIILGELNTEGFKDINGTYHWLKFDNSIKKSSDSKIIPPKYYVNLLEKEITANNYKSLNRDKPSFVKITDNNSTPLLRIQLGSREPYSFELRPYQYHIEENAFSVKLPIELLHKIEEAITYYIVKNKKLHDFLFDLMFFTHDTDLEFDSYFNFSSVISIFDDIEIENWFFGFNNEWFDSKIEQINFDDLIEEYNKVLDSSRKISNEMPNFPQKILDYLKDIEKREDQEDSAMGKGIILKEYYKLFEVLGNDIYKILFDEIQKASLKLSVKELRDYGFNKK